MDNEWKNWSNWLREGFYISFVLDGIRYYEHIVARDFAHYVYAWEKPIEAGEESGPYTPEELEITKGYDKVKKTNNIWQLIFGISGQVYIYVQLPTDIERHGLAKIARPSREYREVAHFEEWMSPFNEPSFITEHFLMRPNYDRISFSAYNPQSVAITPKLRLFIAKLQTERIGYEEPSGKLNPTKTVWRETLDKLYRRIIPHRPITLEPVRFPAEAPSGE